MFKNIYKNKRVLITGHTGFKGSWLTMWLLKLGANIIGISKNIPTSPSLFEILNLENKIIHYFEDIKNLDKIIKILEKEKPEILFHLAAQSIVSKSYEHPIETITTNTLGTANILEAIRRLNKKIIVVIITSDKVYDNVEWIWGYREIDKLGGKDVYSGSKGAAELIIRAYYHSFFKDNSKIRIAIGRAGNVIGGGDFAENRIVVDCMKAWSVGKKVEIRNPNSTRPWQHVLEPLSGYLHLASILYQNKKINGEAFNFGPIGDQNKTVKELILDLAKIWKIKEPYKVIKNNKFHEAKLLKLNCDKALYFLNWKPNLNYKETCRLTGEWYYHYYKKDINIIEFTKKQIEYYENIAVKNKLIWTA